MSAAIDTGRPAGPVPNRPTLLGLAHAERQRLGRMIQFAGPETWEQPSACPGWWNRDVMAHLGAQDTAAAQLLNGDPPVELDEYRSSLVGEGFTVDGYNAFAVNRRAGLSPREVLTLWGKAADAFLGLAAKLDDEAWASRTVTWLSGEIAPRYLVQSRIVEWWVHGEDMRATNGLAPAIEHWPVHLTADLAIRMLPWALDRAGLSFQGQSVLVELEGAGGGSWHWGLSPGEVPPAGRKPAAYVSGRAPQFALVAARRIPAEEALDSGNLVLGGDIELAASLLRHIRCYA
ncbi:MAG: maleylpyruvate isomerase family mycothiol-dependent enzyme [Actinobacteria bacterium]|nr:maleylpyruvate isomerase family mycothiol-dependent enzyme [Actinomycetota bacterium]